MDTADLDAERFGAFLAKPEERTPAQQAVVQYSDALIDELKRAEVVVIGLPMYNFAVPSTLKAYFDHIARAGVTFRYTEKGSIGLLTGKKAYIFATRGGKYLGTPLDTQTAYVSDFLRFIGIEDVEFIYRRGARDRRAEQAVCAGAGATRDRARHRARGSGGCRWPASRAGTHPRRVASGDHGRSPA